MSNPVISKTTFTFTVLHRTDEPLTDLAGALEEATTGHAVGGESFVTVAVDGADVYDLLRSLGNDGSFFDDDLRDADD